MFLFSLILFQFFLERGIEVSPSYINWEGWNGGSINGGVLGKLKNPSLNLNCGILVGTHIVSKGNYSVSYNSININGGLEVCFTKQVIVGGGPCLEIPWGWKYNEYNLSGVSYCWGYYGKISYEIFKKKNLTINTGLAYHNYPMFKDFTEINLNLEAMWCSDSLQPPSLAESKWVILEPAGGALGGGIGGIAGGLALLLFNSSGIQSEEYDIMGYYALIGWNTGIAFGIPLGVWGVGKFLEDEKGSYIYSLLGTVLSEIIAVHLVDKTNNPWFYTIPVLGGVAGYRFDLYRKGKKSK